MNYKITIKNDGNHFCNKLISLDGKKFSTRDEACEALFDRMFDIIDSDNGCEMIECPDWSQFGEGDEDSYISAKDRYISDCKNYIFKKGFAFEDGVLVTVDEC